MPRVRERARAIWSPLNINHLPYSARARAGTGREHRSLAPVFYSLRYTLAFEGVEKRSHSALNPNSYTVRRLVVNRYCATSCLSYPPFSTLVRPKVRRSGTTVSQLPRVSAIYMFCTIYGGDGRFIVNGREQFSFDPYVHVEGGFPFSRLVVQSFSVLRLVSLLGVEAKTCN